MKGGLERAVDSSAGCGPGGRRLPSLLRHSWFSLNQAFRRRLAPLRITPDQYTLLRILHENVEGAHTQRHLVELMCSDPNTIASLLDRMESAGLIRRTADPNDRRAKLVELLREGRRLFTAAREIALDLQSEVMETLPQEEREHFLKLLERVAAGCKSASGRSPPPRSSRSRLSA